jgi:hypothetical protein
MSKFLNLSSLEHLLLIYLIINGKCKLIVSYLLGDEVIKLISLWR